MYYEAKFASRDGLLIFETDDDIHVKRYSYLDKWNKITGKVTLAYWLKNNGLTITKKLKKVI